MHTGTQREDPATATPRERKVTCADCIYLVQTRHHLSQQIIGYHCFSIGRQQAHPQHYDFTSAEIQKEHDCPWSQTYEEFAAQHVENADYSPKIQRYVTIRVKWGYDWQKEQASEKEKSC